MRHGWPHCERASRETDAVLSVDRETTNRKVRTMLIKLAALGALGYAGYKYFEKNLAPSNPAPAFAGGQSGTVRDAGPAAMRDEPRRTWTKTDEEADQSFPASDPPANY